MQYVLLWLLACAVTMVVGAISAIVVYAVGQFLENRLGWHREVCMLLTGALGLVLLVGALDFGFPRWLGFVGVLFSAWVFAVMGVVMPFAVVWHIGAGIWRWFRRDAQVRSAGGPQIRGDEVR